MAMDHGPRCYQTPQGARTPASLRSPRSPYVFRRKKLPRHLIIAAILVTLAVSRVLYERATQAEHSDRANVNVKLESTNLKHFGVESVASIGYQSFASRRLLETEENCTRPVIEDFPKLNLDQKARQHGGFIVYAILGVYMFVAIAIACDDYFVPACEKFCELFKLSDDVAGATFMAAGSSAPELATTCIGVFLTKDDIGIGTVVGSAVFNILCVIGVCAVFAGMVVELRWWPLLRDCVVYTISIAVLVGILYDEVVNWYEAMILLLMYVGYTVLMYFNTRLEERAERLVKSCRGRRDSGSDETMPLKKEPRYAKNGDAGSDANSNSEKSVDVAGDSQSTADTIEVEEETPWVLAFPESTCKRITWIICLPLTLVMFITVPDCRQPRWTNWYPLTFVMSCLWLAVFSYVMVWMITVVGFTFLIPDTVMGLTFIAAGASVPDAIASLIVVRDGYGDMAVSNAVASNVFDILVCLGLPWFIQTTMVSPGNTVQVYGDGLTSASLTLLSTVVFLIVATHINGWRLTIVYGVVLLVIYCAYIIIAILYALNVFGHAYVAPPCPTDY